MAAPDKQKVTFVEDVVVLDHNGEVDVSFKAGQVASMVRPSAERWIRRGKAVDGEVKAKEPEASEAPDHETASKPETAGKGKDK